MKQATATATEVARFDALAASWWDRAGPMRALHRMNPARIDWICRQVAGVVPDPAGLRVLDVGCGAGLAAEALARRGFDVLGIDAAPATIGAARRHAADQKLSLAYRVGAPEDLVNEGVRFPIVTALEVIEHVPEPEVFLRAVAGLLEPRGLLFLSTLNRTLRSFVAAKIGAEYLLRWLPVGTHDWRKFLTPSELAADLRRCGLRVSDLAGLVHDPLTGSWHIGRDVSVNYLMAAAAA
jgi:2-polyprenyl-6-hydroxyphenyl methylase/3-demethylubiquinone-9 3-methyltransferase